MTQRWLCHEAPNGYDLSRRSLTAFGEFAPITFIRAGRVQLSMYKSKRNSKVIGISLLTYHLSEAEAHNEVKRIEDETGLPTTDVLRFGSNKLMDALSQHFGSSPFISEGKIL